MSPTLFTTADGDVILRAGPDPDSKHDFRVHKFILSLASPVFKDMFAFPQPPGQASNEPQLPVVDVPDPPEVLDTILRFVYPGVEPPKITKLSTLHALLSTADKYNIASICPALREILKVLLPDDPLRAYIIGCRFGFSEEAREAARVSTTVDFVYASPPDDLQHISGADLFRLFQFVQRREYNGLHVVQDVLGPVPLDEFVKCVHGEEAKNYYFRLEKAVEEEFIRDPCVASKDLFTVLDKIPDPPPGCRPPSRSGEWYFEGGDEDAFNCPLQPMTIRRRLVEVAEDLANHNNATLRDLFGRGVGNR